MSTQEPTSVRLVASLGAAGLVSGLMLVRGFPRELRGARRRAGDRPGQEVQFVEMAIKKASPVLLAGLREENELAKVPDLVKGTAMSFFVAGILSMAFMGFAGLFHGSGGSG